MNPLIRKELRLILPFWGIAIFLAVLPAFIVPRDSWVSPMNEIIYWAFGFGAILLGLAPFGQEFSLGTFPALLAQPLERNRMWKTKLLLLLPAALLVLLAFLVAVHFRLAEDLRNSMERFVPLQRQITPNIHLEDLKQSTVNFYREYFWMSVVSGGAVLLLVGLAGGFWSSLLFRQTGASLWFAILIPGAIFVAAEIIGHLLMVNMNWILFPILAIYAVAGFIWARRMFFAAQDAQWLGGTISFLSLSPAKPQTQVVTVRRKKPSVALLLKELQSHQVSLLIAFGLLVLHIATLVVRGIYPMNNNSELRFAVEAVPLLWLMLPWVIGSVAVAEERKLGTMEGQLCLPVTRRRQFLVKLLVTLFLGVVLGALIPYFIESLGMRAHVPSAIVHEDVQNNREWAALVAMALGALGIALISFFASTLTRNTLHALGAGVVFGLGFFALYQWILSETRSYEYSLWHGPLVFRFVIPVWLIAIVWLSYSNYKRLHAGRNVWLQNFLILSISLACAGLAAAVVYQRPWELAMTLEPKQGPVRLSGPVRPAIYTAQQRVFALLPDGRLWAATDYEWKVVRQYRTSEILHNTNVVETVRFALPHAGMFVGGSNWVAIAASPNYAAVVALQADGSLWSIISPPATNFWKRWLGAIPDPHRIGSDNDWKSIAAGQYEFVAVKNDGSLWGWGAIGAYSSSSDRVVTKEPKRIDSASDWDRVFPGRVGPLFVKQNGDVYEWLQDKGESKLSPVHLNASNWLDVSAGLGEQLVVYKDGSLWFRSFRDERIFGYRVASTSRYVGENIYQGDANYSRVGNDYDWVQVVGGETALFGLKKDGRIVKSPTELFSTTLSRASANSDWLAIDSHWGSRAALGADGTISEWHDMRGWDGNIGWLSNTRRPFWSLNIFSDSKN